MFVKGIVKWFYKLGSSEGLTTNRNFLFDFNSKYGSEIIKVFQFLTRTRKRTQSIAKRYAFHVNAKTL